MAIARKHARQRKRAKSLIGSMREFLTPAVFKQVRNASKRRKRQRWDLHPLLYILLLTTYCSGDSLPEKFEAARSFYVVCCPKRKRPGVSFAGFEKAVAKLPMPVLRTLAAAIRGQIKVVFADRWKVGSFIPFGCDGTRQACPRTEELERRLGTFGKEGSPPMIWNTSIVHLTLGLPFCWRLGKGGKAGERSHLIHMLRWLPAAALIVPAPAEGGLPVMCSPRGVLLEARRDISAGKALKRLFSERIRWAQRERRVRTSAKQKREWPRRKPHMAPHPPLLLMLSIEQKIKIHEHLQAA